MSRFALALVCALLVGDTAAAVPESASCALQNSIRDDIRNRNTQANDADSARLHREQAYRDTQRMRQLPPEVVAALVKGVIEFDDLSFNDDDTVVVDNAVRALSPPAALPHQAPAHPAFRLGILSFAMLLLVAGILLKRKTDDPQARR